MKPARILGAILIALASAALLVGLLLAGITDQYAANRDFIEYWASGQQLARHANPYDPVAILHLQRAAGMQEDDPQIAFSPPIAFWLLLPLGFVTPKVGLILWSLSLIASLLLSIWLIWVLNGRPDSAYHLGGYLFAPAVASLLLGQIGTFLLLGIVLFLCLHQRRPWLGGIALLPCIWKPHLFLPFFLVLLLWSLNRKEFRVLAGFAAAVLASAAITTDLNPQIWVQYSQFMTSTAATLRGYVPTLSGTLRFLIDRHAVWLQYIPEIVACVWAAWYFWRRRSRWDWMAQGSWVLLVSAACTPYAWFTDEAVLLPAVLFGVYRAVSSGRSLIPIAVCAFAALIEVTGFGHISSSHYLWTMPAWIGWYVYATRGEDLTQHEPVTSQG